MTRLRLVAISDTHGRHDEVAVPEGDILVHAGDLTNAGTLDEIRQFDRWLHKQPHPHKVVIAGNHDFGFALEEAQARDCLTSCVYLHDSAAVVCGLTFYGSPWQPAFMDWAFNLYTPEQSAACWARIPNDTDVLVTHGPPRACLDMTLRGEAVGCEYLRRRIAHVAPSLHVFGHIHEAYGTARVGATLHVNASTCTLAYQPTNAPVVLDLIQAEGRWAAEVAAS